MNVGLRVVAALAIAVAFVAVLGRKHEPGSGFGSGVNADVAKRCPEVAGQMRPVLDEQTRAGIIRSWSADGDSATAWIDDRLWQAADYDRKASIAIGLYCIAMRSDGRGAGTVRGQQSGKTLMTVVDGHLHNSP